jgi:glycosyltransferase involved in cell wall biosynthesis
MVGGRAIFSQHFNKNMKKKCKFKIIHPPSPKRFGLKKDLSYFQWALLLLLFFVPYAFFKALIMCKKEKFDFIIMGDAVISPMGSLLKRLTNTKVALTTHGLDIKDKNWLLQKLLPRYLNKMDIVFSVSEALRQEVIKRTLPPEKAVFIPNGINKNEFYINKPRGMLRKRLPKEIRTFINNRKVLLSVGRFVERKGFNWFTSRVMPKLKKDYCYLIVGDGLNKKKVEKTIKKKKLEDSVMTLGIIEKKLLKLLYNTADVFIMPNIKVKDDMEGFGMVIIEAGSCGTPVVASNIEGIKDAVIHNKTGLLVKQRNLEAYIQVIKDSARLKKVNIRKTVINNFEWNSITDKYIKSLKSLS